MKPENLILLLIAGVGLWYLMRGQTAEAAPTAIPWATQMQTAQEQIQAQYEAVQRARAEQAPLQTAKEGYF